MIVSFFEGFAVGLDGARRVVVWAEGPFGNLAMIESEIKTVEIDEIDLFQDKRLLTTVDLAGLDTDDSSYVIRAILVGKYHSRPGVSGKHDAALFMLVNEALNELFVPVED
ncbi:MAG: hypothetical protein ACP5U1_16680 [Desulfomonilaceae bacterium]